MNKGRRNELKQLKYKKRLKLRGEWNIHTSANPRGEMPTERDQPYHYNYTGYKTSSAPCSCPMCSCKKYNRAKVNKHEDLRSGIKLNVGRQVSDL